MHATDKRLELYWYSFKAVIQALLSGDTTTEKVVRVFCEFKINGQSLEEIVENLDRNWPNQGAKALEFAQTLAREDKLEFAEARDGLIPCPRETYNWCQPGVFYTDTLNSIVFAYGPPLVPCDRHGRALRL